MKFKLTGCLFSSVNPSNAAAKSTNEEGGSVSSLFGYLMYYVRKQIEMNTNNIILSYTVLVVVIACVIICVAGCCVISCCHVTKMIFVI